jgi:transcription initiation factor TFIIH subunit 3
VCTRWRVNQGIVLYEHCPQFRTLPEPVADVNRISLPPPSNSSTSLNTRDSTVLPDPRILILSVSPDLSTSYIPIMNSIFSAQKLVRLMLIILATLLPFPKKVTIDACQVYGPDAVFLQQAAHLTGGSYLFLERRDALLQYLIVCIYRSFRLSHSAQPNRCLSYRPPRSAKSLLCQPKTE